MLAVVFKNEEGQNASIPLESGQIFVVGRGKTAAIRIRHSSISRSHAEFYQTDDGAWCLRDLGSSNHTFLNGQQVELTYVKAGDVLRFGDFAVRIESLEPVKRRQSGSPASQKVSASSRVGGAAGGMVSSRRLEGQVGRVSSGGSASGSGASPGLVRSSSQAPRPIRSNEGEGELPSSAGAGASALARSPRPSLSSTGAPAAPGAANSPVGARSQGPGDAPSRSPRPSQAEASAASMPARSPRPSSLPHAPGRSPRPSLASDGGAPSSTGLPSRSARPSLSPPPPAAAPPSAGPSRSARPSLASDGRAPSRDSALGERRPIAQPTAADGAGMYRQAPDGTGLKASGIDPVAFREAQDKIHRLEESLAEKAAHHDAALQRILALEARTKEQDKAYQELQDRYDASREETDHTQGVLEDTRSSLNDSQDRIRELEEELEEAQRNLSENEASLGESMDSMSELKAKVVQKDRRIDELKQELDLMEYDLREARDELESIQNSMNYENTETRKLERELLLLREVIKEKENHIKSLQLDVEDREKEIYDLKLGTGMQDLRDAKTEMMEKYFSKDKENQELREERDGLRRELSMLKGELEDVQEEAAQAKDVQSHPDFQRKEREIERLQRDLDTANEHAARLEEKLSLFSPEVKARMESELTSLRKKNAKLEAEWLELKESAGDREDLERAERSIKALEAKVASLEGALAEAPSLALLESSQSAQAKAEQELAQLKTEVLALEKRLEASAAGPQAVEGDGSGLAVLDSAREKALVEEVAALERQVQALQASTAPGGLSGAPGATGAEDALPGEGGGEAGAAQFARIQELEGMLASLEAELEATKAFAAQREADSGAPNQELLAMETEIEALQGELEGAQRDAEQLRFQLQEAELLAAKREAAAGEEAIPHEDLLDTVDELLDLFRSWRSNFDILKTYSEDVQQSTHDETALHDAVEGLNETLASIENDGQDMQERIRQLRHHFENP